VLADGIVVEPQLRGGGQEQRRRAGTENLIGIAGFGAAASTILEDLTQMGHVRHWRDAMEEKILAAAPYTVIYGRNAQRLPNTSYIGMNGTSAETQLMAFDLAGIAVSTGAACSSGRVKPSHVLQAMGYDDTAASEAIRISGGLTNTVADFTAMADEWLKLYNRRKAA